jgi:hypothetical protein
MVRSVSPETPDRLPGGHRRNSAASVPRSEGVDGVHAERSLHGHHRPQAAVGAFELLADEAVGDVVEAGAAIALQIGAEHAELGHARDELPRELLARVMRLDDRQRFALDEVTNGGADGALITGEQVVEPIVLDSDKRSHALVPLPAIELSEAMRAGKTPRPLAATAAH